MLYDSHIHIEDNVAKKTYVGMSEYDCNLTGGNLIVNYLDMYDSYRQHVKNNFTLTCIFDYTSEKNIKTFVKRVCKGEIQGAKIHTKIQNVTTKDYQLLGEKIHEIPVHVPVIIDAWYDWSDMQYQPNMINIIDIVKQHSDRTFIIAHIGGYKIMEWFMHTRKIPNIMYDMSLSPTFFNGSSVSLDIEHFVKWVDPGKILYGTDYPYVKPSTHKAIVNNILNRAGRSSGDIDKIYIDNFLKIFNVI